jgi:hypothetical protein
MLWPWVRIPLRSCMDVWCVCVCECVLLFCVCSVLCLGRGLATSWLLVQGILRNVNRSGNWKQARAYKGCGAAQENPSSRTMPLGSTQTLTEMSTRNLPGSKVRPARKPDSPTAIYEPIVKKMWEPQRLITSWASTVCYRDSFTYFTVIYFK